MNKRIHKAFSLAEILVGLLIIGIISSAAMPLMTKMAQEKTGTDRNTIRCINESPANWYKELDGTTELPTEGTMCWAAVTDAQYNRGRAVKTAKWYANKGTESQKIMAKKILRTACDRGGEKACDYFIDACWKAGSSQPPYCDDESSLLDLTYYLHQNTDVSQGGIYIKDKLKGLLTKNIINLSREVNYACVERQKPDRPEVKQNLGNNIACDLTEVDRSWWIQQCNKGNADACKYCYDNEYNRSCHEIKSVWSEADSGFYELTANGDPETNPTVRVKCNMTSLASAAITGCGYNADSSPAYYVPGDCEYGRLHNYNKSCDDIFAWWGSAPEGHYYNLTADGAEPPDLASSVCPLSTQSSCGPTVLKGSDTGLGYDLEVTNCNIAINPQPNDHNQSSGCWYGASPSSTCTGTGCDTYRYLCTHDAAEQACENLVLGGKTDWRLPTLEELKGWRVNPAASSSLLTQALTLDLCDYSNSASLYCSGYSGCSGSKNNKCFPSDFWSSSQAPSGNFYLAWLDGGNWKIPNPHQSNFAFSVRCVREAKPECGIITLSGAGSELGYDLQITECNVAINPQLNDYNQSSGCWYGAPPSSTCTGTGCDTYRYLCTHDAAEQACENLVLGGKTDWSLPTLEELKSLRVNPAASSSLVTQALNLDLCDYSNTSASLYCSGYSGCSGSYNNKCFPSDFWSSSQISPGNFYLAWLDGGNWKITAHHHPSFAFSVRCARKDVPPDPPNTCNNLNGATTTLFHADTDLGYDLRVTNCNIAINPQAPGTNQSSGCWDGGGEDGTNCSGTGCGSHRSLCTYDAAQQACDALNQGVDYGTIGWRLPTNAEIDKWKDGTGTFISEAFRLNLCGRNSGYSPHCNYYHKCDGAADGGTCYPDAVWAEPGDFGYINPSNKWAILHNYSSSRAHSVRCVRKE